MRILIIGGTLFLGRAFANLMVREKWKTMDPVEIILINRGNAKKPDGVDKMLAADRHNGAALQNLGLRGELFDAVVDFCAYEEKDIAFLVQNLGIRFTQYIFISTCDVYKRFEGRRLDENGPLEDRVFPGEEGAYVAGKVKLEEELKQVCREKKAHYTSIRPSMIYGPNNYAPREGIYFNWINKAGQIIQPFNATGFFQLVYVEDVAKAIFLTLGNKDAYDQAFNVCGTDVENYLTFFKGLQHAITGRKIRCVYMTVDEIRKKNIGLPFPLTEEESEEYRGNRIQELGLTYTSLGDGLAASWDAFEKEQYEQKTYIQPPKLVLN
ncbi:MAG: NAD-dependent epimerase/dehydratase family protein [Lachnospiraceae bacterium]|nr:NAD-dependent epimerase/dehydratase family protein [Lachnospiraceae bacterium]